MAVSSSIEASSESDDRGCCTVEEVRISPRTSLRRHASEGLHLHSVPELWIDTKALTHDSDGGRRRVSFTDRSMSPGSSPSPSPDPQNQDNSKDVATSQHRQLPHHLTISLGHALRAGSNQTAKHGFPLKLLIYCAGPALDRARPLVSRLEDYGISVTVRTDEDLRSAEQEADCDALLVLWSQFFQGVPEGRLIEISEQAGKAGALVLNDVRRLVQMQDRRWLLRKLKEYGLPVPTYTECSRDGGHQAVLEEHEDYIVVDGNRMNKPFVEKPVDRRDREIYVYFPKNAGGGRALLSTRESGDIEYVCRFDPQHRVRREGSFVYQEYLQSEGFVVQLVCVGGLSYGNAVRSGVVTQRLDPDGRGQDRSGNPCAVWLRQEEKIIASKLNVLLHQTLFGLTFVRSQTASGTSISYVIDVWPGIPRSGLGAHRDDVVRGLLISMSSRLPKHGSMLRSRSLPRFSAESRQADEESSSPKFLVPGKGFGEGHVLEEATPSARSEASFLSSAADSAWGELDAEADQLCVLLVARHSERSPKQKVKAKVTLASEFAAGWLCGWLAGEHFGVTKVVTPPSTFELRSPDQLHRLALASRQLQADGHEVKMLADALYIISGEGIACHAKVGCDEKKLVVGLKWGGELTKSGVDDAEEFGKLFRRETYPKEDIDELHASLRHDIKVYASREPRCQQTAAAFCKGLLRLPHALPPIIAALVRTDEFGRLEGSSKNYVDKDNGGARKLSFDSGPSLSPTSPWDDWEAIVGVPCVSSKLREFSSPAPSVQALQKICQKLIDALQTSEMREALCNGETALLLKERYKDAVKELGSAEAPVLEKVSNLLDHLEFDYKHNSKAIPETVVSILSEALPLCQALCDVLVPAEYALERNTGTSATRDGMPLLSKLRWDLRVASGADLGDERGHLSKHEALYAAVSSVPEESTPQPQLRTQKSGCKPPSCVRTRLYFSHNSQLSGLLSLLLQPSDKGGSTGCTTETGVSGSEGRGRSESDGSNTCDARALLALRLGFLAHFVVRLWRKRSDGALRVTCDFSPNGADARVRLFDLPFAEVDSRWSEVLDVDGESATLEQASPD